MLCDNCTAKIPTVASRQKRVNDTLHSLGLVYHKQLGDALIRTYEALRANGFTEPEVGHTLPTDRGVIRGEVGHGKWLTLNFFRMESGNYEVVAYVN